MDTATFPNRNAFTTPGPAAEMAGQIGTAAEHVLDATKAAGKQIGAVAKEEITTLRADLDDLTSRFSSLSESELIAAKEKILTKIESSRVAAKGIAADVTQQINRGVGVTTDYVKERPLQSVVVAAGMGLMLGMLISRR